MVVASACGGPGKTGAETMRTKENSTQKRIGDDDNDGGPTCPRCDEPTVGATTVDPGKEIFDPCGCVVAADGGRELVELHREDAQLLHDLAARQLRDDRATIDGGALEAEEIGYDDYTMSDAEGVLEDVQEALDDNDDTDGQPTLVPDGGHVDFSDVACPRCMFGDGAAQLGANLCSNCGGWFRVDQCGRTVASPGPDRPVATDGAGHGNYYAVDGEHDHDADEDAQRRRATIERHEDGGYLISDGGVMVETPDLVPSQESLLEVLYTTGSGTHKEIRERFAEQTGFAQDTASGRLSELRKHGLVDARANPRNPGASIWSITPDGEYFVESEIHQVGLTDGGRPAAEEVSSDEQ